MARPEEYPERAHSSFRIPPDLLAAAKQSAADHDVSYNLWLERAMRRYLAYLVEPKLEARPPWSWKQEE